MGFTLQEEAARLEHAQECRRHPNSLRVSKTARPNLYRQPQSDDYEKLFRHEHWAAQRKTIRSHLAAAGTGGTALERWDNCGAECLIEWSDEAQRYRLRASYCKNRHCRPCAKSKAGLIAANLRNRLEQKATGNDRYRFITLTLRHSKRPLREQIRSLYSHFTKLRATKFWKRSQRGGAFMIECGWNKLTREWHPHLHIIGEGDFLRQDTLANEWMKITSGSFKVDVRAINSGKDAVHYVSKYVTKGTNDEVWSDDSAAQEWIIATRSLRTCATYGTWRGYKLMRPDKVHQVKDWKPIALLSRTVQNAIAGSLADMILLEHLCNALQYNPHKPREKRENSP